MPFKSSRKSKKLSFKKRQFSKMAGGARKTKRTKRSGKRKLNNYFKAMLSAKKQNLSSFMYNKKKYVGSKHKHLGMIYKKQ
jgi:hypothetical protein